MKDKHSKKKLKTMAELDKDGEMSVEDVAWLTSLSETEIDILISLKLLIIQRAEMIGYANLANKFDLKMIRVIAFVLMELLKEEVKDSSVIPDTVKSVAFLDACNLSKCDNRVPAAIEELSTHTGADIQTFLSSSPTSKRKEEERLDAENKPFRKLADYVHLTNVSIFAVESDSGCPTLANTHFLL